MRVAPAAAGRVGAVHVISRAVEVKPDHEAEFPHLLTPVLDAMRREASFINAAPHREPEDPRISRSTKPGPGVATWSRGR